MIRIYVSKFETICLVCSANENDSFKIQYSPMILYSGMREGNADYCDDIAFRKRDMADHCDDIAFREGERNMADYYDDKVFGKERGTWPIIVMMLYS